MTNRPNRVPATRDDRPVYRREIATAGDPEGAMLAAMLELPHKPGLMYFAVGHDDECPCRGNELAMASCTCEIVQLRARHCETLEQYAAEMRKEKM